MPRSTAAARTLLLVAALCAAASPALAQRPQFGLRASAYLEDADPAAGVEVLFPFADHWAVVPNAEVVFDDDDDRFVINVDVQRVIVTEPEYAFWLGGGIAFINHDHDHEPGHDHDDDEFDDEFGLNLLAGIGWRLEGFTPYAQVKVVAADDAELVASVGVRF